MANPKSTVDIEPLQEADIPAAIKCVQDAFLDDPFANFIYDRSKFSDTRNHASLTLRMQWGMRNGKVFVAHTPQRRCAGVAMWMCPREASQTQTWGEWLEEWKLWFGQVQMNLWHGRGGLLVKRYYAWKSSQSLMQSELWTDPRGYWFLNILCVHPDSQGLGIGKALANAVTHQADITGHPCYLESSKLVPNVAIYERLGFRMVKELVVKVEGEGESGTGCTLFSMIRDPKPIAKDDGEVETSN